MTGGSRIHGDADAVIARNVNNAPETPIEQAPEPQIEPRSADAHNALAERIREQREAEAMVARLAAMRSAQPQQVPAQRMPPSGLTPAQADWLAAHPEVTRDQRLGARVHLAHLDAIHAGFEQDSEPYWRFVNERYSGAADPAPELVAAPAHRPRVSAPVSRSVPGSRNADADLAGLRGRIELTPQEREAAKISGVSEREYAQQKIKLMLAKRGGNYPAGG
jgi:hypothetical protein